MLDLSLLWIFALGYTFGYFERNEKMKELICYLEKKTNFIRRTIDSYRKGTLFDSPFVDTELISSPDDRYVRIEKIIENLKISRHIYTEDVKKQ